MANFIEVTQVKSVIGNPEKTRRIIKGLGLRGIGGVRVHKDNNCIRGMVNKVKHLISYRMIAQ
jgi:large subunit ribosomal protein L30